MFFAIHKNIDFIKNINIDNVESFDWYLNHDLMWTGTRYIGLWNEKKIQQRMFEWIVAIF